MDNYEKSRKAFIDSLKDDKEVFTLAINKFGKDMQRNQAIEEMSELIKELCKDKRDMTCKLKIAEEIADVEIMIEQLKMIYYAHEMVDEFKSSKVARLRDKLVEMI